MKFIDNIDKKEYDDFVISNNKSHFLQSYNWGVFSKEKKGLIPVYVGLKDKKNKLVAATLILQKKLPLGYSYFYAPRGFIIDFNDKELLTEFVNNLKKFCKKKKAVFLKIDPDLIWSSKDSKENIIANEKEIKKIFESLKDLKFKHLGFTKNFDITQPRYTFRLSLKDDINTIFNNFHDTTKKVLKRGNPYQLEVSKNNNEIEEFYFTMLETAKREELIYQDLNYYKAFYNLFKKEKMSDLYVIKVDIKNLKKIYKEKQMQLKEELKVLKNESKRNELINQLNKLEKEKQEVDNLKEEKMILSSILTAKYGNKVWTLYGGNNSNLRWLNANYFTYYEIIKDAKEEGYEIIDFFGTTGDPKPDNPIYGIHLFKKRLGGNYIEFIGEFDLVINKPMYLIFTKLIPIYHKIKKKKKKRK